MRTQVDLDFISILIVGDMLDTFVIPHIRDLDNRRYFQNLDIATAEAEDLSRAIFMVTQLPKAVKNPIFARNLRDNYVSTLARELSSLNFMYYSKEQKEKDETLAKLHKDFAPVLQELLHTAIQTLRKLDGTISADTLLFEKRKKKCLCQILFEFFGKHVVQPR